MRETRYLWVGNLPENIREEKLVEYFKRYGRIERTKILSKRGSDGNFCAVVAFVDIRSAQKAQISINMMGDRQLQTNYSEPAAINSASRHIETSPLRYGTTPTSHRNYPMHRTEGTRSFEGHSGERGHVNDRYRASHSGKYREEHSDQRGSQKHRELRDYDSGSSSNAHSVAKPEKKASKSEPMKEAKKKLKRQQYEEEKPIKKASKVTKQKERGRSPTLKKKYAKKKQEVISSSDEDDGGSSSSYSSESSEHSSSESSASSSVSSSRSNSSSSSSSRSSVESEQEGQKLVTIIIKKLPSRPSVNNLRDGIYHEFKKCGKVKSVVIRGDNACRHALVLFRNAAEANKAISHAKTKLLFGAAIEASIYEGEVSGKELQECGGIIDEFHPRASRTLFVGNLDKTVQHSDIQNIFVRFGEILALEIKKQNSIPQYAFLQYTDIASVVKAMQKMDGEKLGRNSLKLGFGKTVMSSCVWVDGVTDSFTEKYLASCFAKHGIMKHVVIDRRLGQALVFYTEYKHSQQAISGMRARNLNGSRLKLDYASHELVDLFLTRMRNSGQSATTFENVRNLLLPAPNAPGVPPPNPSLGGSRSGRSSSGHPYSGGGDSYYDDIHPSRYHGPPHGYDSGPPPRGDWRSWEERNRGRPVYQNVSPRGRRYNDDRGAEYYHREDDYYDRAPGGRYDPEYRAPDYRREHGRDYPPRGYEDYHRGMKQRDKRDTFHHSRPGISPARALPRRSRSISPRSTGSGGRGRAREFDPKGEARLMEHRDHSAPHTRDPVQSPGSREERGSGSDSWSSRKYRERLSSPAIHSRRDDQRRVELRDFKSQPSSPRPSSGVVRSKVVHESPASQEAAPWSEAHASEQSKQNVEFTESWVHMEYDRSRSETPTRDENLGTIGEVIIKQPSAPQTYAMKQEAAKQSADEAAGQISSSEKSTAPKSRTSSRASSGHSDIDGVKKEKSDNDSRPHLLLRVRSTSPSSDGYKKKHREKVSKDLKRSKSDGKSKSRHAISQSDSDSDQSQHAAKKPRLASMKTSKSEGYRESRRTSSDSHEKSASALIKREFSPALKQKHRQDAGKRSDFSHERKSHKVDDESSSKKSSRHSHDDKETDALSHKKRRYSQSGKDPEGDSPAYDKGRRGSDELEHKPRRHKEGDAEPARSSKRSRRASYKHEAPMPVASQCFQEENEDDNASTGVDSDSKEPSSSFRPRVVVKEEVVEVMPEESTDDDAASPVEHEASFVNEETVEIEEESSSESAEEKSEENNQDESELPETELPETDKKKRKSRWDPETVKTPAKVAIAQPFNRAFHPYTSKPIIEDQESIEVEQVGEESKTLPGTGINPKVSEAKKEKLSKLEEEKAQLQELLSKLDSKEKLMGEDANKVADIFISDIKSKLKSQLQTKKEKESKEHKFAAGEVKLASPEVETTVEDVIQEEVIQEEAIEEFFEIEQAPDVIEEQTIVEEEVTSSEEVVFNPETPSTAAVEVLTPKDSPSLSHLKEDSEKLDSCQGYRKQMEAKRSGEKRKSKEKELRSLFRKQKKERERQKRRVEQMRGPSQQIVSSIDEEDEERVTDDESEKGAPLSEEQEDLMKSEKVTEEAGRDDLSVLVSSQRSMHEEGSNIIDASSRQDIAVGEAIGEDSAAVTSHLSQPTNDLEDADVSEPPQNAVPRTNQQTPVELKSGHERIDKDPFAIPVSRENATPTNLTPKTFKADSNSNSPLTQIKPYSSNPSKVGERSKQPTSKTPSSASPYTPVSTPSEKSALRGTDSSSFSSSPKVKAPIHLELKRSNSRHGRHGITDQKAQEDIDRKRKKAEQAKYMAKHAERDPKSKSSPPSFTNLTVSNISPSEPLGKKELETLRAELETMKSQLNREMSPGFLSPSSDNDGNLPPISPILKSPTVEREASLTPDTEGRAYGRAATSPLLGSSPSAVTSPVVPASPASGGSSILTKRMKLLVKVKKKAKSEESAETRKIAELREQTEKQKVNDIGNSRFFRSSIFDQDSERLSHLQTSLPEAASKRESGRFAVFAGSDILDDKPLFCSLAEKAAQFESAQNIPSVANVPKNAFSLSSESDRPAPAERPCTVSAGNSDIDKPPVAHAPPPSDSPVTAQSDVQSTQDRPEVADATDVPAAFPTEPGLGNSTFSAGEGKASVADSAAPPSAILTDSLTDFTETIAADDVIDVPFNTDEVTVESSDVIIEASESVIAEESQRDEEITESEKVDEDEKTLKESGISSRIEEAPPAEVEQKEADLPTSTCENSEETAFQKEPSQKEQEMVVDSSDLDLGSSDVISSKDAVTSDVMHESVIYDATEVVSTEIVLNQEEIFNAPEMGEDVAHSLKVEEVVAAKASEVPKTFKTSKSPDSCQGSMTNPEKSEDFIEEKKVQSSDAVSGVRKDSETEMESALKTSDSDELKKERSSGDELKKLTDVTPGQQETPFEKPKEKLDTEKSAILLPKKSTEQSKPPKTSRSDGAKQGFVEESGQTKKQDSQVTSHSDTTKKPSSSAQLHKSESKCSKADASDAKEKKPVLQKRSKSEKLEKLKKEKKEHRKQTTTKDSSSKSENKSDKPITKATTTQPSSKSSGEKLSGKTVVKKSDKSSVKSEKHRPSGHTPAQSKTSEPKPDTSAKSEQITKSEKSKVEQKPSQKPKSEKGETIEAKSTKMLEKIDRAKVHETVGPKHHKISEKKVKSSSVDVEKKTKAFHSDNTEKKKEHKVTKPAKDAKDVKLSQTVNKKQKLEEGQKMKASAEGKVPKTSSSVLSKKFSDGKSTVKKMKLKSKSSVSTKSGEKTIIKAKHSRPSSEEQPVKKRPKLDDSSDIFGKKATPKVQSKPALLSSDLEDDFPTKAESQEQKSKPHKKSLMGPSDNDSRSDSHPLQQSKLTNQPAPKPSKSKSSFISSDSDSEDNYDNFISQMSGGSSMMSSSAQRKGSIPAQRHFSSSSDDSSSSEPEKVVEKVQEPKRLEKKLSHKVSKSERYDSDRSDKSVSKKSKVKLIQQQTKPKEKKSKQPQESSSHQLEKSKQLVSDKKSKLKGKLKKAEKFEDGDTDSEDQGQKQKPYSGKAGRKSDSDSESIDEKPVLEKKAPPQVVSVQKNQPKSKRRKESFPEGSTGMQKHMKNKPGSSADAASSSMRSQEKSSQESLRKSSTSSSEEDSLRPPPSPTSTFLTTQTIKRKTVIHPEYMDQFSVEESELDSKSKEASKSTYHDSSTRPIYTSSSSSDSVSDFGDKEYQKMSNEESLKFLGDLSDSSDSFSEFSEEEIAVFDRTPSTKASAKHVKQEKPEVKPLKQKKTSKEPSIYEGDNIKAQGDVSKVCKSSSKPSDGRKESAKPSKHHKPHDPKHLLKASGSKDKKLKQESDSKTVKDKPEPTALIKSKDSSVKSQDLQKLPKKLKQAEDKYIKDKSSKVVHKENPPGDKVKKQTEKKPEGAKLSHSEKSHKSLHHESAKRTSDKQRPQKDTSEHPKAQHHSVVKSKPREQLKSKHSKDVTHAHNETKSTKGSKFSQEVTKHKKESKSKNTVIPEKKLADQKVSVPLEKKEKKKSPKPEKPYDVKPAENKESEFLLPSLQIDESPEAKTVQHQKGDDSMPGKRFFYSDSSSDEEERSSSKPFISQSPASLHKEEEVQQSKPKISGHSPSKRLPSPIKLPSTSTHQKSLFSPTEENDAFSEDKLSALIKSEERETSKELDHSAESSPRKPDFSSSSRSPSKPGKIEKEYSQRKGQSDTERQSRSDAETEERSKKSERGRSRSRDHSPSGRTKRLSSLEQYQLKQQQYREHITELKKLSQQRDEEAVRSIMSGDDTSDLPYFGSSGSENINQSLNVLSEKKSEYPSTPSVSEEHIDSTTQSDTQEETSSIPEVKTSNKKIKNPTPEPRSTAEEVELAAALRSIEGFGDFTSSAKEEVAVAPQNVSYPMNFKQAVCTEQTPSPPPSSNSEVLNDESEEAAKAASALLQEADDQQFQTKPSRRSGYLSPERKKEAQKSPVKPPPSEQGSSLILPSIRPAVEKPDVSGSPITQEVSQISKTAKSPIKYQPPTPDPTSRPSPPKPKNPPPTEEFLGKEEVFTEAIHGNKKPLSPKLEQPPQEVTSSNAVVSTEATRHHDDRTMTSIKCDSTTDIVADPGDHKPQPAPSTGKPAESPKPRVPAQATQGPAAPRPFVSSLPVHIEKTVDPYPLPEVPSKQEIATNPTVPTGPHPDLPRTTPRRPSKDIALPKDVTSHSTEQGAPTPGVASVHASSHEARADPSTAISPAQRLLHPSSGHNVLPFVPSTHPHGYPPFPQPAWRPRYSPTQPADKPSHAFAPSTNPTSSGGTFKFPPAQGIPASITQPLASQPPFSMSPQTATVSPKSLHSPQQAYTPTSTNQAQFPSMSKGHPPPPGLPPHPQGQMHPGLPASVPNRSYPPLASPSVAQSRVPLASPKMTIPSTAPTTHVRPPAMLHSPVASGPGPVLEHPAAIQVPLYSPRSVAMTTMTASPSNRPPAAPPSSHFTMSPSTAPAAMISHPLPPQTSTPSAAISLEKTPAPPEASQAHHPSPQVHRPPLPTSVVPSSSAHYPQPGSASSQDPKNPQRLPLQAPTEPNQPIPQFAPHQSMFYPQGITLHPHGVPGMRQDVPFPRQTAYRGYSLPMSLTHGMNPQQQGQPPRSIPSHIFQQRTHSPYADMRSQPPGGPAQAQLKLSPSITPSNLQQPQPHPGKGKITPSSNTPNQQHQMPHRPPFSISGHSEIQTRPQDDRFHYPPRPGEAGRTAMSVAAGSSKDLVDLHFRKALLGSRAPTTQAQSSSGPMTSPGTATRSGYPPQQQYRPQPGDPSVSAGVFSSLQGSTRLSYANTVSEVYQRAPTPIRGQHVPPHSQPPFWPPAGHHQVGKVESQPGPGPPQMDAYSQRRAASPQEQSAVAMKQRPQESSQDPLLDLFQRYPIIWQGKLALKNDFAAVQIHYVCGNLSIARAGLPKHSDPNDGEGLSVLRIIQRMRIKPEQMEPLYQKMARLEEFCVLLALPCGRDKDDVVHQTAALSTGFIQYLQQKQVAGIVNVEGVVESAQQRMMLVLHVFPPCDFTNENLNFRAPDLLSNVADIHHLMIVVTST